MRNKRPTIAGGLMVLTAAASVASVIYLLLRSSEPFEDILWLLAGIAAGATWVAAFFRWAYLRITGWVLLIAPLPIAWLVPPLSFLGGMVLGFMLVWFPHCWSAVCVRPSRWGITKGLDGFRRTGGSDREAAHELLERLLTLGCWTEAEEVARSVADTDAPSPTFSLAIALVHQGKTEEGIELLNGLAAAHPDDASPHIEIAILLLNTDATDPRVKEAADQAWARCGIDTPPSLTFELAWIYAKWIDRRPRAIPLLKMVVDEGSAEQSTNAHALLSEILRGTDDRAAEAHRARARSTVPRRFRGNLEAQLRWLRKTLEASSGAPQEPVAT